MNKLLKFCLVAAASGLMLSSCKKDSEQPDTFSEDQQVGIDQNQADNEAEDVSNLEDQVMDANEAKINGRLASDSVVVPFDSSSCTMVTIIPKGNNPTGKITIDFGTGCLCRDGRTRKGKIISVFTDRVRKQGAVVQTSYEGYGVTKRGSTEFVMLDNSSTKKTTTVSAPEQLVNNSVLSISRELNMKMQMSDGLTFSYAGTKNIQWDLGMLANRWDNVYTTKAGSSLSGTDRKGRNYTLMVDTDVVRKAECAFIGVYKPVSGQITISHNTKTKVLNFGDGTCDNTVDVTINGKKTRTRW
jgi:hypothetical protein